MADESTKVDIARQERLRERAKEPVKHKPAESEFKDILEKGKLPAQLGPQAQAQSKNVTEQAVREALKHEERQKDEGEKKDRDKDEKKGDAREGRRSEVKTAHERVVAKAGTHQDSQSQSQQGRHGEGGGAETRRNLTRILERSQAKSLPSDLQGKFAANLAKAMQDKGVSHGQLAQHVLNKLVQYVRIGLNRKGEKEIAIELNERIFKGLKLKVTSRGGKVAVTLQTSDIKGREALEKNRGMLAAALKKRGIEVDEIVVS